MPGCTHRSGQWTIVRQLLCVKTNNNNNNGCHSRAAHCARQAAKCCSGRGSSDSPKYQEVGRIIIFVLWTEKASLRVPSGTGPSGERKSWAREEEKTAVVYRVCKLGPVLRGPGLRCRNGPRREEESAPGPRTSGYKPRAVLHSFCSLSPPLFHHQKLCPIPNMRLTLVGFSPPSLQAPWSTPPASPLQPPSRALSIASCLSQPAPPPPARFPLESGSHLLRTFSWLPSKSHLFSTVSKAFLPCLALLPL